MGVTYTGKQLIRDLLSGDSSSNLSHFGWGAGSTAFHDSQTILGSELFPSGGAVTRNTIYTTRNLDNPIRTTLTGRLESDQLNTGNLYEIGLFTAGSGGTMFNRQTFYRLLKTGRLRLVDDFYIEVKQI